MRSRGVRGVVLWLGVALFWSASLPASALGDGGIVRAWVRRGNYEIAVFTEPALLVTGPVDISVLLLDPATGEPIPDAEITVEVVPKDRPGAASRRAATFEAATNKLLRAAVFDLDVSGLCEVLVIVDGPKEDASIRFDVDVANSSTPRAGIWSWVLWPVTIIAVYAIHRRLVGKGGRSLTN